MVRKIVTCSKFLVTVFQSTRCNIQKDFNLQQKYNFGHWFKYDILNSGWFFKRRSHATFSRSVITGKQRKPWICVCALHEGTKWVEVQLHLFLTSTVECELPV
jgi:hypothetical protein